MASLVQFRPSPTSYVLAVGGESCLMLKREASLFRRYADTAGGLVGACLFPAGGRASHCEAKRLLLRSFNASYCEALC